jgi:hypothetical protein
VCDENMLPLTVILIYIAIISFLIYTFKNQKPLKWSEITNAIPFYQYFSSQAIQRNTIPGPLRLPILGTKWQNTNMSKLHEYYESKQIQLKVKIDEILELLFLY